MSQMDYLLCNSCYSFSHEIDLNMCFTFSASLCIVNVRGKETPVSPIWGSFTACYLKKFPHAIKPSAWFLFIHSYKICDGANTRRKKIEVLASVLLIHTRRYCVALHFHFLGWHYSVIFNAQLHSKIVPHLVNIDILSRSNSVHVEIKLLLRSTTKREHCLLSFTRQY